MTADGLRIDDDERTFPGLSDPALAATCWRVRKLAVAAAGMGDLPDWDGLGSERRKAWGDAVAEGAALVDLAAEGEAVTFAAVAGRMRSEYARQPADFHLLPAAERASWLAVARHLANVLARDPGADRLENHEDYWPGWVGRELKKEGA